MVKNILLTGSWYGEISSLSVEELREKLVQVQDEKDCILQIEDKVLRTEVSKGFSLCKVVYIDVRKVVRYSLCFTKKI